MYRVKGLGASVGDQGKGLRVKTYGLRIVGVVLIAYVERLKDKVGNLRIC